MNDPLKLFRFIIFHHQHLTASLENFDQTIKPTIIPLLTFEMYQIKGERKKVPEAITYSIKQSLCNIALYSICNSFEAFTANNSLFTFVKSKYRRIIALVCNK